MHINELLANHDAVLSEVYKAKRNKAEGKINPWPRIKESKDHILVFEKNKASKLPVKIFHNRMNKHSNEIVYIFTSL
jgi:hypothetical protein